MSIKKKCKKIILIAGVAAMAAVPQFAFADCSQAAGNGTGNVAAAVKTAVVKSVNYSACRNVGSFCKSGWKGSYGIWYPGCYNYSGYWNCGNSCSPDDQNGTGNADQNGSDTSDGTGSNGCGTSDCINSGSGAGGCTGTDSNCGNAGNCGDSNDSCTDNGTCGDNTGNGNTGDAGNTGTGSDTGDSANNGTTGSGSDSGINGGTGSDTGDSANNGTTGSGSDTTINGGSNSNSGSQDSTASSYASQVADIVNQERAANGLSSLSYDSSLARLAQLKAEDMAKNNYFSHQSPTYGSAFDMMKTYGVSYRSAGENIARGQKTPSAVMDSWMNSSGHKANILSSSYSAIGVGSAVDSSGRACWVQMFKG